MTLHDLAITRFGAYWRRCYRGGHAYAEVAERTGGALFKRESTSNHAQAIGYRILGILLLLSDPDPRLDGRRPDRGPRLADRFRTAWRARWRRASFCIIFASLGALSRLSDPDLVRAARLPAQSASSGPQWPHQYK